MNRRRRYEPDWPNYGPRRKGYLRTFAGLVALIITALVGSRFLPGGGDATATAAPTSTARAGGQATAGRGTPGPLAISERDGGWFAAAPLAGRGDAVAVQVRDVIDGDTIDVLAAQTPLRVRFYGVDTPERNERCYAEATQRTRELTRGGVLLVADARQQDPGGRELRYVFAPDGRSVDATLVAEGLAKAWRDDGTLRSRLVAIEDRARRDRTGCLWG